MMAVVSLSGRAGATIWRAGATDMATMPFIPPVLCVRPEHPVLADRRDIAEYALDGQSAQVQC
jgi:hypothetical protein